MDLSQLQCPFPASARDLSGNVPEYASPTLVITALNMLASGVMAHCPVQDSTVAGYPLFIYSSVPGHAGR